MKHRPIHVTLKVIRLLIRKVSNEGQTLTTSKTFEGENNTQLMEKYLTTDDYMW